MKKLIYTLINGDTDLLLGKFSLVFFYNTGSLDGNEILRQFLIVVNCYETIGIKIYSLICDAGGGNRKFYRILQDHEDFELIGERKEIAAFINPMDNARTIAMVACSTHCLKAMRNNLYKSQPQLARSFLNNGKLFLCVNVFCLSYY